jgi:hypothetical protein
MKGHSEKKTRKAEQFIAALLAHPSIEAAAKSVGIGTATAWRWMKDPKFAQEYRNARREAMRHTTFAGAAREAVECLREVQRTGESESARVSAAPTILERALKAVDPSLGSSWPSCIKSSSSATHARNAAATR